jgi:hypothetical protein
MPCAFSVRVPVLRCCMLLDVLGGSADLVDVDVGFDLDVNVLSTHALRLVAETVARTAPCSVLVIRQ